MTYPFDNLDGLRFFFESRHGKATVGYGQSLEDCPVARYLKGLGFGRVRVTRVTYQFRRVAKGASEKAALPAKLRRFITKTDRLATLGEPISASTALRILDEVRRERWEAMIGARPKIIDEGE